LRGRAALCAEAPRVLKFGVVGLAATAVHVVTAFVSLPRLGSPFMANLIGFLAAFCVSYTGQALWTFDLREGHRRAAGRFFVVAFGSFLFSTLVLGGARASGFLPNWASLLLAIAVVPGCTFVASRLWVFKPDDKFTP